MDKIRSCDQTFTLLRKKREQKIHWLQSSSASQKVPVKVKLQPAPELSLTHNTSLSRSGESRDSQKQTYRYIKMQSLHMIVAWENKWPTLPQLDFTTVSCHDIDTLCNIWEAVYRWTEVAWVGALIQNKCLFLTWNKMKLIKKCEVRFTVQDINSTHCSFVQEVRSWTDCYPLGTIHTNLHKVSRVPWTLKQRCASP